MDEIIGLYMTYLRAFGVVIMREETPKNERRRLEKQFSKVKTLIGLVTPVEVVIDDSSYAADIMEYANAAADLLEREDLPLDIWEIVANAEMHVEILTAPSLGDIHPSARLRALGRGYYDAIIGL